MLTAPIPPTVPGTLLTTTGAEQVVVADCPNCRSAHRHLALGLRRSPCGAVYVIQIDQAATGLRAA